MNILSERMYVCTPCMCTKPKEEARKDPLELELQTAVSLRVVLGNEPVSSAARTASVLTSKPSLSSLSNISAHVLVQLSSANTYR